MWCKAMLQNPFTSNTLLKKAASGRSVHRKRIKTHTEPVLFILSIILLHIVSADWWELGLQTSMESNFTSTKDSCYKYLLHKQKELCDQNGKIISILSLGAKMVIEECQKQFINNRWNCSTYSLAEGSGIFGNDGIIKSREKAFMSAISAASIAYSITRACSKGDIINCGCDPHVRLRRVAWKWGPCSDNIRYGMKFSRDFLDKKEDTTSALGLMNLHNNEAGRRSVRSHMQRICKCHGMSGSCTTKVCWRRLPQFKQVGQALLESYEGAYHVSFAQVMKAKQSRKKFRLRPFSPDLKKANKTDLVYLDDSPDYCEQNDTLTILGTRGRLCNRTSPGISGCSLLCCGRGYQTRVREVEEKCDCRFVWCCNVECQVCRYKKEEHICN